MIEEELPDELENDLDDIEPVGDESQLYEHFRVVVDKGQAMVRVDKYLFERIVNASRNRIQKAAEGGFVMANGKPVKSSYKVKPLDVITVMMDRPRYENEIIPEDIPLTIVYEDPYVTACLPTVGSDITAICIRSFGLRAILPTIVPSSCSTTPHTRARYLRLVVLLKNWSPRFVLASGVLAITSKPEVSLSMR